MASAHPQEPGLVVVLWYPTLVDRPVEMLDVIFSLAMCGCTLAMCGCTLAMCQCTLAMCPCTLAMCPCTLAMCRCTLAMCRCTLAMCPGTLTMCPCTLAMCPCTLNYLYFIPLVVWVDGFLGMTCVCVCVCAPNFKECFKEVPIITRLTSDDGLKTN